MFSFIKNTITLFLGMVFIAIPLSFIVVGLLAVFLSACFSIAGGVGAILGVILLIAMLFASMIRY